MHSSLSPSEQTPSRLTRLLDFLERDGGNLLLRKDVIREALSAGRWEMARTVLATGLDAFPGEAELLAWSGLLDLRAQRYAQAEHGLAAALRQGLEPAEVRYNMAFALFMQKRYAEALAHLTAPLLAFELPLALILRARCLHHLGQLESALAACRDYLTHCPDDAQGNGFLGLLLYERHDLEAARGHVEAALKQQPEQQEALLAQALSSFDAQDFEFAARSYGALVHAHPQCGRGWLGLALLNVRDMQFVAARDNIERSTRYMPEHIGSWHVLAWIQIMLGNVVEAKQAFERALAIDRNFSETHGGLAVIAALQRNSVAARVAVKRALRLDPRSLAACYAEVLLLQQQGSVAQAEALLEAALSRPVPRSDMQYRDLVALQIKHLRARGKP